MTISGIYLIRNIQNNKIYYGSSKNIKRRINRHKKCLEKNIHSNKHLQHAWNLWGNKNFIFSIVEEVSVDKIQEIEQKYLNVCKSSPDQYYNISYDAFAPTRGLHLSENHKQRISQATKGKIFSMEHRLKISSAKKGVSISEEQKIKACKNLRPWPKGKKRGTSWNKGKLLSDDHKLKLSIAKRGKSSPFKGKYHSKETKKRMKESAIKRWEKNP